MSIFRKKKILNLIVLLQLATVGIFSISCAKLGGNPESYSAQEPRSNLDDLKIKPENPRIIQGENRKFHASGGYPGTSGYKYSISGLSGKLPPGSIDPKTGVYTAPANVDPNNAIAFVIVTDELGETASTTAIILVEMQILPTSSTVTRGQKANYDVQGGQAPFTWCVIETDNNSPDYGECLESATLGDISSTGLFNSHTAFGSTIIEVTDVSGNKSQAVVVVKDLPDIRPTGITIPYAWPLQMTVIGGSEPFSYFLDDDTVSAGGVVSSSGVFTAPSTPLLSFVEVRDNFAASSKASIFVINPNKISAGDGFTCIQMADSAGLKCWGDTADDKTGYQSFVYNDGIFGTDAYFGNEGNELGTRVPLHQFDGGRFVASRFQVSGYNHTCIVDFANQVRCFGGNAYGQLGIKPYTFYNFSSRPANGLWSLTSGQMINSVICGDGKYCGKDGSNNDVPFVVTECTASPASNCSGTSGSANSGATVGTNPISANFLSAGSRHTCSTNYDLDLNLNNRQVQCWGDHTYGQLGIGTNVTTTGAKRPLPILVAGGRINFSNAGEILSIKSGEFHTCVLLKNVKTGTSSLDTVYKNQVRCWGRNNFGQLGINSTTGANAIIGDVSTEKTELEKTSFGAAGSVSTLPVTFANTTGATYPSGFVLQPLAIATGANHTCALLNDDTVRCWGDNSYGQLGKGTTDNTVANHDSPDSVSINFGSLKPAKIFAGFNKTCIIFLNGDLKCLGDNTNGSLGIEKANTAPFDKVGDSPSELGNSWLATDPDFISFVTDLAIGKDHLCAMLNDNRAKCWGSNDKGQLGINSATPVSTGGILNSMREFLSAVAFF